MQTDTKATTDPQKSRLKERFDALSDSSKVDVGARVVDLQEVTAGPRQAARIAIAFTEQVEDRRRNAEEDELLRDTFPASDPRGCGTAAATDET